MRKSAPDTLCRKCGTANPSGNAYCRKCGVVMSVSTGLIRAQRSPLKIRDTGMKWRFVPVGLLIMIGTIALGTGVSTVLGLRPMMMGGDATAGLLGSAIATTILFFVSFFVGGALLSRLSKRTATPEAVLSSALAILLLGVIGSALAADLMIAAGIALIPSAGAAWLGAHVGGFGREAPRTE